MNTLRRVCLIVNFNLYESKRYFTDKLAEAMRRRGIEAKIIDVQQEVVGTDTIQSIRSFEPNFTCSFNSFESISQGRYLWDFLEIPHISFLVDPSFYSTSLTNSAYSVLTCVDRSDCTAIKSSGFDRVLFWPHAVEQELTADDNQPRTYEVVLLGSCYDFESLRVVWQQRLPATQSRALDDAIDIVFSDEHASLADALVRAWNASKLDVIGADFGMLYYYLDNYTRGKDRVDLVRSIKDARIDVFGELPPDNTIGIRNWHYYLSSQRNVTVHPSVPFGQGMEILKKSKIVLNSMPFFRDGSHERIFTGLACGCLPVTSESKYLREQFVDGEELLFYSAKNRAEVNALINEWLSDEEKRYHAAERGRRKVVQYHTWDHRVMELVSWLEKQNNDE